MMSLQNRRQHGATLLVGMIMMVVLTLLVVFSLRSGNTNLRIAGNMQSQAEASAATQQVLEQVIEQIKVVENPSLILAQEVPVTIGNVTYTVDVSAISTCVNEIPVMNEDLNYTNPNDVPCFEGTDDDKAFFVDGSGFKQTSKPSACKMQQWDIEAGVTDDATGAKVTQVQGISIRVPSTVNCL